MGTDVFTVSVPLKRSNVLYPVEKDASGNELKMYYKIGDIDANGHVKAGVVAKSGQEYADYLETGVDTTLADYGVGVTPKAVINSPLIDDDGTVTGVQWKTGTAHAITAAFAQPNSTTSPTADLGTVIYAWSTSDGGATIINPNSRTGATISFATTGAKTITLKATNAVTGVSSSTYVNLTAIVPPINVAWDHTSKTASVTNLPATTKYVRIYWGDGAYTTNTITVGNTTTSATHTYTSLTGKVIPLPPNLTVYRS